MAVVMVSVGKENRSVSIFISATPSNFRFQAYFILGGVQYIELFDVHLYSNVSYIVVWSQISV